MTSKVFATNRITSHWQSLLGPVITEELIAQAHADVRKGLHHMLEQAVVPEKKWNTISNVECACGCGTLLSQKTVDRGWTVIRGHKVKFNGAIHVNPQMVKPRALFPSRGTVVNMDAIDNFINAQLKLTREQLKDAQENIIMLQSTVDVLARKESKLIQVRDGLKEC